MTMKRNAVGIAMGSAIRCAVRPRRVRRQGTRDVALLLGGGIRSRTSACTVISGVSNGFYGCFWRDVTRWGGSGVFSLPGTCPVQVARNIKN